jgi:ABC-type multidrug transport system fused ATPase/permease subunit
VGFFWVLLLTLLSWFVVVLVSLVVLGYGGYDVIRGSLTLGGLVAFYSYTTRLFGPSQQALDTYSTLIRGCVSIRRLRAITEVSPKMGESERKVVLPGGAVPEIEFSNVAFQYREGEPVLTGASFEVRPGERVALVGPTGSGKSTVAKLILQLYDQFEGGIAIGGSDIRSIRLDSLRSFIALVPQDPVIFSGTLRHNLLYSKPDASDSELQAVATIVQLAPTIRRLAKGWEEMVGTRGAALSGGERQRIALARALLRSPAILVIDEATSALDPVTEERLIAALDRHMINKTIILISHRPSVQRQAGRTLWVEGGRVTPTRGAQPMMRDSLNACVYQ